MSPEVYEIIRQGERLSEAEAQKLEEHVRRNPNDVTARIKLLGYYSTKPPGSPASKPRAEHVLWFAQHHPQHPVLGTPFAMLHEPIEGEAFAKVREVLLLQARRHPRDARILSNASAFLAIYDRKNAIPLAQQAVNVEPRNVELALQLAKLYELEARSSQDAATQQRYYQQALHTVETALTYASRFHRLPLLTEAADLAARAKQWQKAEHYAQELLKTPSNPILSRRPDPDAWHTAHTVLGKVALARGDLNGAKRHLLESAKVQGSPVLSSFGPDFSLARALLERGEQQAVLEYLNLCEKFWHVGKRQIAQFRQAIREGRIPKFGFRGE